jgi:integrase
VRGHIRRRGQKWAVVVDLGRDPETGRRRQKWHSGYATRRAAERDLAEILSRLSRGTYVEPTIITVAEWLEQWLQAQRPRLRPATFESYGQVLRGRVVPEIGAVPLQALTAARLDRLYAHLLTDGRARGGALSPRSTRYTHTVLRRALGDAVRKGLIERNPTDAADPPSASEAKAPTMRTWSAEEVSAFLRHVADDRLAAAWRVLATTGMRRGEVLGLRWRDLDLERGRATVVHTVIEGPGEPRTSRPKGGRGRSVALDQATARALRAHRKRQAEEKLMLAGAYFDRDLVFCREDGAPLWPRSFSRAFEHHAQAAGLPRIRLHDLRHTWATLALGRAVHPKVVQERLGHATVAITLDVYSHAVPAMQEDAAERVAALFAS